ncbi:MAG: hypothetical protein ACTHXB_06460 [Luteimonas sp.]
MNGGRRSDVPGTPSADTSPAALRALPGAQLDALYADFHRRVFACYEGIDELPAARREAAQAKARRRAEPMIEQARAVHEERVRRLRLKARRWWIATVAVAVAGSAGISWLALR